MSPKRWLMLIGALAIVVVAYIAISGGSTDHTSEWSSEQTAQVKGEIAENAPEFTSEGVDCLVKGAEAAFPPSDLSKEKASSSDEEKIKDISKKCAETSSNVQGVLSQACQQEGFSGENCLNEIVNQATEGVEEEFGLGSEGEEGSYGEESPEYGEGSEVESNPEAEEELNNELKQEEQESVENGEEPATP